MDRPAYGQDDYPPFCHNCNVKGMEIKRLREALERIVRIDYRGNRHQSHDIARQALSDSSGGES